MENTDAFVLASHQLSFIQVILFICLFIDLFSNVRDQTQTRALKHTREMFNH